MIRNGQFRFGHAILMSACVLALCVSPLSRAEDKAVPGAASYPAERLGRAQRLGNLIGLEVRDVNGVRRGRIEDVIADLATGQTYCALVWPLNIFGANEYVVAVPASCFLGVDSGRAIVDLKEPNLSVAPRFVTEPWASDTVSNSLARAYKYFGAPLTWDEARGPGSLTRCATLLDVPVKNQNGVDIGSVADLTVDLPAAKVTFVLVAFFGADANLHPVPPSALGLAASRESLQLNVKPSQFGALVSSNAFLWADMANPAWAAADYHAFGSELVFHTNAPADYPSLRERLRARVALPAWEPDFPTEITSAGEPVDKTTPDLARSVLIAIVQDAFRSGSSAQDVRVTADGGKVTLAGKVGNKNAKRAFAATAERVAGAGNVTNEIEVQ